MIKQQLKRIVALAATVGVLGASLLTNAQGNFPPPIPKDQKVKISFYSYNLSSAGIGKEATEQLMNEFMELNPNIEVEGVAVAVTELMTRNQADIVAGNPPDISQLGFGALDFMVNNWPLKALEDIVPPDELQAHFAGFIPKGPGMTQLNGKTWGLAYTFSTPVLFYNADLFRAAGLNPDQPPTTWEEAKVAAAAIVEKTDAEGLFIAGYGPTASDWVWQGLVRSNGGSVLSEDRKTLLFAEEPGVGVVRMWQDLAKNGLHPAFQSGDATTAFGGGMMGMYLQSSALQASLIKSAEGKFELRAAKMPAFGDKPTSPPNSGSALYIMAQDPLKQRAAWEFLKFVTSERGYTIITSKIGYLPLRPGIVDDPKYLKEWAEQNPLIRPNLEQLERLEPNIPFPGPDYAQIVGIMMKAVEEAIFSDGDPAPILKAAQEQAQALMPK